MLVVLLKYYFSVDEVLFKFYLKFLKYFVDNFINNLSFFILEIDFCLNYFGERFVSGLSL